MSRHKHRNRNRNRALPATVHPPAIDTIDASTSEHRQPPVRLTAVSASFQGPLPPPAILAQYSQVVPNGAERILAMAERQQTHRQNLESTVVGGNVSAERRGQIFAFILGMVAILGGIGLIAFGKDALGISAIITAFTTLAGVFVYGRHQQSKERAEKRREAREAAEQPRLPLGD